MACWFTVFANSLTFSERKKQIQLISQYLQILWLFQREKTSTFNSPIIICNRQSLPDRLLNCVSNGSDLSSVAEISENHFSVLETRMRISHIQSRTSRREREFLSPNLMLREKTENNFLQSQASRRDRDLFFSISDYETRTKIFQFILSFRDENENL